MGMALKQKSATSFEENENDQPTEGGTQSHQEM